MKSDHDMEFRCVCVCVCECAVCVHVRATERSKLQQTRPDMACVVCGCFGQGGQEVMTSEYR